VAATWGTTSAELMGLFGETWRKATVAGIAASFSNTVLVGISIILSTFGEPAAAPLFLLISIHLPVMTTVGTVLMEAAGGERTSIGAAVRRTGAGLVRNPLMIAIVAGALWRTTSLPLPSLAKSLVDMLGQAASPTALFAMGMSVNRYGVLGDARSALVIVGAKLILLPLAVYALAEGFRRA
jgi:predicted permease